MAQLAIKGHPTRGKEVIEILEMLGGENGYKLSGTNEECAYYEKNGRIHNTTPVGLNNFKMFTLEQFLEKFPYKVGDSVSSKYLKNYKIEKAEWESCNNRVIYKLQGMGWYSVGELEPYKEETMDKVSKSVFDANAQCCDIMNRLIKEETMEEIKIDIPKGYEFFGIDYDNKIVLTKKQSQYPKTYEECEKIFGLEYSIIEGCRGYNYKLLNAFQKLLMCRDAYWKIAGDQMGLGKPWEPDFENEDEHKYGLFRFRNIIYKDTTCVNPLLLVFPTEEMRDTFYENFKELIEECKELL